MPDVRAERSGWRDEGLSKRHREWGWDCPAMDIDFLMLEYTEARVCALVEYKNQHANLSNMSGKSYKAIVDLADRAKIPAFVCVYSDDFSLWKPMPLNSVAKKYVPKVKVISEKEWVKLLYMTRNNPKGYEYFRKMFESKFGRR